MARRAVESDRDRSGELHEVGSNPVLDSKFMQRLSCYPVEKSVFENDLDLPFVQYFGRVFLEKILQGNLGFVNLGVSPWFLLRVRLISVTKIVPIFGHTVSSYSPWMHLPGNRRVF